MAKTPSMLEIQSMSPIKWVEEERFRQVKARGTQDHNPLKWFTVLAEEFGEVARALEERTEFKLSQEEYLRQIQYELIQLAAVSVAFIEAIRRAEGSHHPPICVCKACSPQLLIAHEEKSV